MSELRSFRINDPRVADRVQVFPESVIREMTRLALKYDAVNLAQGFPDWDPPKEIIAAAKVALAGPFNQYSVTWGAPALRKAVSAKMKWFNGIDVDPDQHVTVTCGATEAMMAVLLAVIDPGDEVIVFEPFYENYAPDAVMSGARLKFVPLLPERDFAFDEETLKRAFTQKTKAVILNTPSNPCGKVFTRAELKLIGDLCVQHDALLITDEIYEHILYGGRTHVAPITLPGLRERTIMISGASKTYSVTGWRVAWIIADPTLSTAIRRTHDFLTVGAPHPLQIATAEALALPKSYYDDLGKLYDGKRKITLDILKSAGFRAVDPEGAYYIMADFSQVNAPAAAKASSTAFSEWLCREVGVSTVPGASFFSRPELGDKMVRFCFPKKDATLHAAGAKLAKLG